MASNERGTVTAQDDGTRLDVWLVAHTSIASRNQARKALASGKVTLDDVPVGMQDAGRPCAEGQVVAIAWSKPGNAAGAKRLAKAGVELLYVDRDIAVANKPTGLLTDTATRRQFHTRDSLRKQLRDRLGGPVWPAHRIDRDTTGVVAFARSEEMQEILRAQWAARTPQRIYLAILEGRLDEADGGRWGDWMAWDAKRRLQCPSAEGQPHAVFAEADYTVQKRHRGVTAVRVSLVSGRRNQIRLQAMLRGHPLVGEVQYRKTKPRVKMARQALHAEALVFTHPSTGEEVRFEAPLPADMRRLLSS